MPLPDEFDLDDDLNAVLSIDPVKLLYDWSKLPKSTLTHASKAIQLVLSSICVKHAKQARIPARKRMSEEREGRKDRPATRKRMSEDREGRGDRPATRKRMSEETEGRGDRPATRKRMSEETEGKGDRPSTRKPMSEETEGRGDGPATRKRMSEETEGKGNRSGSRKRVSEETEGRGDRTATRKCMSEERNDRRRKKARTKEWECHNCDLSFRTQAELKRHENIKGYSTKEISIDKNHKDTGRKKPDRKCNICDPTFRSQSYLRRHMNDNKHTIKQKSSAKKEGPKDQKTKHSILTYKGRKRWRCGVCKKTLSNKSNLKRHYDALHAFEDARAKCNVNSQKVSVAEVHKESEKDVMEPIMFVCDCTMATAKVDCAFEHAQLHHLEGYKPILKTCDACKFTFEALYFAEHLPNHCENELKPVNYSPSKLLHAEWCDMFPKLSEAHINRIKSTSIYEHTRKVKMNCDDDSGKPLYQCETCDLFVSPKEVEDHCIKENDYIETQSIEHFCCDCEIFFYTSEALKEHEKEHEDGLGVDSFRTVTFNCKRDATINKALRQLQINLNKEGDSRGDEAVCPIDVPAVETQQCKRKYKGIEILENRLVNVSRLCCGKFIPLSELKTHKETHRINNLVKLEGHTTHQHRVENVADEKNQRIEKQVLQEQNIIMSDNNNQKVPLEQRSEMTDKNGTIPGDKSSQEAFKVFKNTYEDTINQGNNNSCGNLQSNAILEKANMKRDAGNTTNAEFKIATSPSIPKITGLYDNFSEEMKNELRQDLQKLISEGNTEKENFVGNKELIQDHEEFKNSEDELIMETQNTNEPNEIQDIKSDPERLLDVHKIQPNKTVANTANYIEECDSNNIIEILDDSDENEISATKVEIKKQDESESNPRPSSRYILSKMLPTTSCESDLTDAIEKARIYEKRRKLEHQLLIEEAQRIRGIMLSRD